MRWVDIWGATYQPHMNSFGNVLSLRKSFIRLLVAFTWTHWIMALIFHLLTCGSLLCCLCTFKLSTQFSTYSSMWVLRETPQSTTTYLPQSLSKLELNPNNGQGDISDEFTYYALFQKSTKLSLDTGESKVQQARGSNFPSNVYIYLNGFWFKLSLMEICH